MLHAQHIIEFYNWVLAMLVHFKLLVIYYF